jgi:hypothetical protein
MHGILHGVPARGSRGGRVAGPLPSAYGRRTALSLVSRIRLVLIGIAAVLLLVGALAGCRSMPPPITPAAPAVATPVERPGEIPEPEHPVAAALEVTVREISGAPVAAGGWLIPGQEYAVDIVVRDLAEQVYRIGVDPESDLWERRIVVRGAGLEWIPTQRRIQAAARPDRLVKGMYELTVELTGEKRFVRKLTFRPDWPLARGLQPEDVTDMRFTVRTPFPDGALLPGEAGRLFVQLKDQRGREYTSDMPAVRAMLAASLAVRGEAIAADLGRFTVSLLPDWFTPQRRRYEIELALAGARVRAARIFPLPPLAYLGPEPDDVQSLDVPLRGLNADDTLDPGKAIPFQVRVTDKKGRVFATGPRSPGVLPLPWSRLTVQTDHLRVNFEQDRLEPEPDPVKMAGKSYQLTIAYGGRKNLTATFVLKPYPYAWYRDRMLTAPLVQFATEPGQPGQAGRTGPKGEDARGTSRAEASPGHPGQPGGPGAAGQRGPDVTVAATLARTFDSLVDLIFVEVSAQGKRSYFFRKPTDPPLKIVSSGGRGGAGGAGGEGGAGGSGAGAANGADGGPGGSGGPGSSGGDGGDIHLFLSRADLQRHFELESVPGAEGAGGGGGAGGPGGRAGAPNGLNGRQGQSGFTGPSGQPGRPGQVSIYTGGPAADLNNNPPGEFKERLFLANFRVSSERKLISGPGDSGRGSSAPSKRR